MKLAADGRIYRAYTDPMDAVFPTIATESVLITGVIDVKE